MQRRWRTSWARTRAPPRWKTRSRAQTSSCSQPGSTRPGSSCPPETSLLEDKVVVDPSNPIGFDENGQMIRTLPEGESSGSVVAGLLPASAHYVKAFGTLGADQLATSANREPRVVLFYATDDDAAEATAQRLIRAAGFEPLKVAGVSDAGRIERPRRRAAGTDLRSRRGPGHHRNRRSEGMSATETTTLPDYAPIPSTALGPALNEQGYYVGRVERNLYYVTDGTYMCAFLTTSDGVVVLDAPPTLGNNIQRAIDEIAAAQRRQQQGRVPHLLAPPLRPRRRGVAVRQERDAHRARGDAQRSCCGTTIRRGRRTRRRSRTTAPSRSAASGSTSPGTAQTTRPTTSSSTCPTTTR